MNFKYAVIESTIEKYNPNKLTDGFNLMPDGEEIFYISNPALGLWTCTGRFKGK